MSKVEDFFITPLEAHYDTQPKEGPRETIIEDLSKYSPDDLHAAAEWLKRNKQSVTSFPSPKECNAAVKVVTTNQGMRSFALGEAVTKENFGVLAVEYVKAHSRDGSAPTITPDDSSWEDWLDYYRRLGMHAVLSIMPDRKTWTVPSLFPSQFDPTYRSTPARKAA